MKMTIKHARTTRAAALLPRTALVVKFTPAEVRRIEKAAKICGWKAGEGAGCARLIVLRNVAAILQTK